MSTYTSKQTLTREQKETVFLLSIGTFLESFDLMLYVHMAVLLNKLFFPQGDKLVAEMFAIFTFCATFILRPIGGLLVGWIGDHIGRKNTIIITTFVMAFCCVTMASIGTYEKIGITASVVMIICRIL
jgi:MHS family proline/betaine transporter-like MFS transporter